MKGMTAIEIRNPCDSLFVAKFIQIYSDIIHSSNSDSNLVIREAI